VQSSRFSFSPFFRPSKHGQRQQKSGVLSELVLEGVFRPRFPLYVAFEGKEITGGDDVQPGKVR